MFLVVEQQDSTTPALLFFSKAQGTSCLHLRNFRLRQMYSTKSLSSVSRKVNLVLVRRT